LPLRHTAFENHPVKKSPRRSRLVAFTIGHSNRSLEDFMALLRAHGIARVIDIRSIPKSRRHPQFNRETLCARLRARGIRYVHLAKLGGWRRAAPDSINLGWRNAGFRGYADYMQTPEFSAALDRALGLATTHRSAFMCAEAVPWHCHRSLLADAILVRGVAVEHIVGGTHANPHKLTPFARVRDGQITYPASSKAVRA
jgi:uncharacterized protein (DUF488 family)